MGVRLALISDIHANSPALEAVLSDISERHADRIICLGDIATIGFSPNKRWNDLKHWIAL